MFNKLEQMKWASLSELFCFYVWSHKYVGILRIMVFHYTLAQHKMMENRYAKGTRIYGCSTSLLIHRHCNTKQGRTGNKQGNLEGKQGYPAMITGFSLLQVKRVMLTG